MKAVHRSLAIAAVVAAVAAAAVPLAAAVPSTWNHWRYAAPVDVDPTTTARLIGVVVPPAVIERSGRAPDDLRVIDDAGREVPFVFCVRRTTPDLAAVEAGFTADTSRPHRSMWVSTADLAGDWVSELRFEGTPDEFDRPVTVDTSPDGRAWQPVAFGEIYRRTDHGQVRAGSAVRVPETQAAHWRVTIDDRNDPPLAGVKPVLYVTPRRVVFRQEPGRRYSLIYGNAKATATDYEFARLTDADAIDAAAPARLGAETLNAGYDDPAPWTERHPIVLWAALGLAALVLGLIALRTLRTG